jgi:lipopolysaccharide/colanic/teichoic acid biosynthesis glycosyltransferase
MLYAPQQKKKMDLVDVLRRPDAGTGDGGPRHWYLPYKSVVDFAGALALLILLGPVILLLAVLVKLTSRGPAFYSQTRVGRWGRPFRIHKLRTMVHDCERLSGVCWSVPGDSRITWFGRFLRRTHLDELPQLWNVVRGEMSLVGPRPERPEFVAQLSKAIPRYKERMHVRPGVTGLAQIQLPADTDLESVRRKLRYDLYYTRWISPWLDLQLLFCTAGKMLGVPGWWSRRLLGIPGADAVNGWHVSSVEIGRAAWVAEA